MLSLVVPMDFIKSTANFILVSTLALAHDAIAVEDDLLLDSDTVVMTPTRLRQPLEDVPASVTVITAKMLKDFGIMSVPDALRMVPGMAITQVSGNDFRINYHGTNALLPRRMNVLIDGVPAYRPAASMARVDWYELPVDIEDIQRIEVTRSPNSAAYGSNSMLAIINIITKTPEEEKGVTFSGRVGSLNTKEFFSRYAGNIGDHTAYRISFSHQEDAGYELRLPVYFWRRTR
jgi:iron complex outermembrane recepter protein